MWNAHEPSRFQISGLQIHNQGTSVTGRVRVDDGINQRQSDNSAGVAHEIKETARVGDPTVLQMAERQARWRQKTEHDGKAANDFWPEPVRRIRFPDVLTSRERACSAGTCPRLTLAPGSSPDEARDDQGVFVAHDVAEAPHDQAGRREVAIAQQTFIASPPFYGRSCLKRRHSDISADRNDDGRKPLFKQTFARTQRLAQCDARDRSANAACDQQRRYWPVHQTGR